MTPAARMNSAINLLDQINDGAVADRSLAEWGRKNRYAGSKDRAAIADIVYDVLRRKRSLAAQGGGETGRALLLGYLRDMGQDPETVFGADRYAPTALTDTERAKGRPVRPGTGEDHDIPDWLWPDFCHALGDEVHRIADALRQRAPTYLRVNLTKLSRACAVSELEGDGIIAHPHELSKTALEVTQGARRVRNCQAYLAGKVELQDASSQAVADLVPLQTGETLLDFCAGGGGKILAIAGRVAGRFFAHDADPRRMKDLPSRAARAGAAVTQVSRADLDHQPPFDTILVDAPCSGSGSWRRDPQGKWLLTPEKLLQTVTTQADILDETAQRVRPGGHLVYATCSLLSIENSEQVDRFLARTPGFSRLAQHRFTPLDGGDGFYCAILHRNRMDVAQV